MRIDGSILTQQERAALKLRELYTRSGYARFRMNKFEHYDLYARNRDYLLSEHVLTFTDMGGRLKALRPDVTLSIVKSFVPGATQRLHYLENVYRPDPDTGEFQEIMQLGLECLGSIGEQEAAEVLGLAASSLHELSGDYMLTLSDMGLIRARLNACTGDTALQKQLLKLMGQKNLHGIRALCAQQGLTAAPIEELVLLSGTPEDVLPQLNPDEAQPLKEGVAALRQVTCNGRCRIDFSLSTDAAYYDGILFKGYLSGLPGTILAGGRYDPLMRRMGKQAGAIGFAVYLDQLEGYAQEGDDA